MTMAGEVHLPALRIEVEPRTVRSVSRQGGASYAAQPALFPSLAVLGEPFLGSVMVTNTGRRSLPEMDIWLHLPGVAIAHAPFRLPPLGPGQSVAKEPPPFAMVAQD